MGQTYTVWGLYDDEACDRSGLAFEDAFVAMMRLARCSYRWECSDGETRILVRYEGPLPEAYDSVRDLQSPYFRSREPNEALARAQIMRSFLRTGLHEVFISADDQRRAERARREPSPLASILQCDAAKKNPASGGPTPGLVTATERAEGVSRGQSRERTSAATVPSRDRNFCGHERVP